MRALRETPVSALYDGGNNLGMVTMYHVTQVAISKAREHGFAVVGVNNSWESGRGAHYVEMVARADLIGIHPLSATPRVAPPGGAVAALGTNPLAVGFPTERDPFVIDIGTSAFMFTDLIFRIRRGEQLPEGVAIDAEGKPTRDPAAARKGALLSFGGHRGFALAMAMQGFGILAGAGSDFDGTHGFLMIAVRPDLMMPLENYKRDMSEMLARIKATPRQAGVEEIRLPSERSFRERAIRMKSRPSPSGSFRSVRHTSGEKAPSAACASASVGTLFTSSSNVSRSCSRPLRVARSSSTTRTFMRPRPAPMP